MIDKDKFISMLYHVQMVTKLYHLDKGGSGAYAVHLHCEELYRFMDTWLDDFVETLQGEELRMISIEIPSTSIPEQNMIDFYKASIEIINRSITLFDKSWQLSKIDELLSTLNKFMYKIHFLR